MSYLEAVLLGVIQGLTEFLPISSSGHLVLVKFMLGIEIENISFEIFVHFGTLLAVITVFKDDILIMLKGLKSLTTGKLGIKKKKENMEGLHLLGLLIVGTLPSAILGYIFKESFEKAFSHPEIVCGALIITGIILMASKLARESQQKFDYTKSFWVGIAQVAAILPGISRSGTTISTGLLLGIQRVESARFSFLLAIPLILGATLLQSFDFISHLPSEKQLLKLLVGTGVAYLSGLFAIKWLLQIIKHGRFDRFAYYCFGLGIFGFIVWVV